MEANTSPQSAPIRAAATVVMLRDGPDGLEVFLLKRHGLSDVMGGSYVFPGGKLDAEDAQLDMRARLDLPPSKLHQALNEPQLDELAAAALYVAALREAFEEAGVLYAMDADETKVRAASRLLREGHSFADVLASLSLRLEASLLQPWSRWITPIVPGMIRKRFDTRFFLAPVPQGQRPMHDDYEATDSIWLTPRAALQQYWDEQIELHAPQILSLAHLSRHGSMAAAMAEARVRKPPLIEPQIFFLDDETRVSCYPGDEGHPIRERVIPGPTRLLMRGNRNEPADGFESLFSSPED